MLDWIGRVGSVLADPNSWLYRNSLYVVASNHLRAASGSDILYLYPTQLLYANTFVDAAALMRVGFKLVLLACSERRSPPV